MNYHWRNDARNPRQHWLHVATENITVRVAGLVYELNPEAFSVYGENYGHNLYARVFLGIMPTLEEAKDMLLTITASQQL